ncbi:MAG TPA: sigma-54 dependent transcriptional regulator [Candidatus Krumholzibacteria bacterium]|nr:sigma-54 dependent transcriptional regulator [Candidatus Krumholzibacteria bacterium]
MPHVLLVDDEKTFVKVCRDFLEECGHRVTIAHDGDQAVRLMGDYAFDAVVTDLRMEPVDGMAVLDAAREQLPGAPVIMLTGHGSAEDGVTALAKGAVAYVNKPYNFKELSLRIDAAVAARDTARQNRVLRRQVQAAAAPQVLGESSAVRELDALIRRVAPSDATVLIRGESGTGKEVAARAIHAASARAKGPFVAVNCAAISGTLLESELFGYRKGAFTGAEEDREGLFEAADGGTLFLDEIGEAAPEVQAKLLRVLQERKINRVGDPREREVDVRVLAATNRPLEEAIAAGRFREDLYYRLQVFPLAVPPLRERKDDIPLLAHAFLKDLGRPRAVLPRDAVARLQAYAWPGNVRELRNVVERAHILAGPDPIGPEHVLLQVGAAAPSAKADPEPHDLNLERHEKRLIRLALDRAEGNKTEAARLLGITRRTLYSRLNLLGLDGDGHPESGPGGSPA